MGLVVLTDSQREDLRQVSRRSDNSLVVRRALGIIWLEKDSPREVAQRLNVTRQTVYNWLHRWNDQSGDAEEALQDIPHTGRPATKREMVTEEVKSNLKGLTKTPEECGYQASGWTATLIVHYLEQTKGEKVHENTVRRALKGMRYRWKRPRYVLARKDPNWRQAKGGLKRG
jgi:transposase